MMAPVDAADGEIGGGATVIQVMNELPETADEISPLLVNDVANSSSARLNPKMNIFSVSYPRKRNPKELASGAGNADADAMNPFVSWVWGGSRYSGLLCAASSCIIYFFMEVLTFIFPVQSIPVLQTLFTRCTIILLLSVLWLRRTAQPLVVPTHVRNLLLSRSVTGLISVLSFIYSAWNLPLSLAITLNFATPIMALIGAKIILQERLTFPSVGGIACSFLGLLLIFLPMLLTKGNANEAGWMSSTTSIPGNHPILAIFVGVFSSILGGISHCLIRAGAKSSDHPVYTILSFGLLATPVSAMCTLTLQKFVLPGIFTFLLMVLLATLSFFAEISLARGLQLEKVSKVANILYIKVLLSQVFRMSFMGVAASSTELFGCLIILASTCSTLYLGPEMESDDEAL